MLEAALAWSSLSESAAAVQQRQLSSPPPPSSRWKYALLPHAVSHADTEVPPPIQSPAVMQRIPLITTALDDAASTVHVAAPSVVVEPV
jgi:hypothetical protein